VESVPTSWALHLYSGVPVVNLEGGWNEGTDTLLTDVVTRLVGSGHTEIIVNLTRATGLSSTETNWLDGLERLAAIVRARRGRLDIVGTLNLLDAGLRRQARSLLGWATSEEEALCRIKGLPVVSSGVRVATRLA
jgi:hypothetical protein